MRSTEMKQDEVYTVDIHSYQVKEAKYYLERLLVMLAPDIKEVVVIHGYRGGTALMNMVRKELHSKRISRRFLSLNPGITSLILTNSGNKGHIKKNKSGCH